MHAQALEELDLEDYSNNPKDLTLFATSSSVLKFLGVNERQGES